MDPIGELVNVFKKFPGIGTKSARRIAFYLLKKDKQELVNLGRMIATLKNDLYKCKYCGNISNSDPCPICKDPLRDKKILCVVEDIESLSAFEQAGIYNGLYHVLGEHISPFDGHDISDECLDFLIEHIKKLGEAEIIIATNPVMEGELTFYAIVNAIKDSGVKFKNGGSIEFADKITLHTALDGRTQIKLD